MELEELMEDSIKYQETDFYKKKFYYSYSSMNKLLFNPQMFYQMYVLGMKEEKLDAHLVQGKLIHLLLLEPEKFEEHFMLSPLSLPSGNLRAVLDRVYQHHTELKRNGDPRTALEDFENAILDVMQDMNYHQSLTDDKKTGVTGDRKRLDKIITTEALNYWEFLRKKGTKTLVDNETYEFCKTAVKIIKTNRTVGNLIGLYVTEMENKEVFNELFLQLDLPGKDYGLKGIIDNIVVDHDAKKIYLNDIKTTSKDLKDFSESVEYYSYWLQCIMYLVMATYHFDKLIDQGYDIDFHFVVIDRFYQTYAFPVTKSTLEIWLNRFKTTLETAEWHYVNRSFDLPYSFAKGEVTL